MQERLLDFACAIHCRRLFRRLCGSGQMWAGPGADVGLGPGADVARWAGAIQSATSKCATALWRMKEDFHENVTYHGKRCAPCADAVRY